MMNYNFNSASCGLLRSLHLLLCLLVFLPGSLLAADAVICSSSSDGHVSSLMGTDFDRDPRNMPKGNTYPLENIFANTPMGIRIYPNSNYTDITSSYIDVLNKYDANEDHFKYDWLRAHSKEGDYSHVFTVTDSLHKLFPRGRGLPLSNFPDGSNSFFLTSAQPNGCMCGVWFPYDLFRGRKFKLSYRFYLIEADSVNRFDAMYYSFGSSIGVGGHNGAGNYAGTKITISNDRGQSQVVPGGNGINILDDNFFPGCYKDVNPGWDPVHKQPLYNPYRVIDCSFGWNVTYDIDFVDYGDGSYSDLIFYPFLNASNMMNYRVVFDYINIAMEHLCVDKDSVCPGQPFYVTAIDYSHDATVEWQYCVNNDNNWKTFATTDIARQNKVKFTVPSATPFHTQYTFRTHQIKGTYNTDVSITHGYSIPLTVTVASAAQCTPPDPDFTVKDMCASGNTSQTVKIDNVVDIANYVWSLTDPDGRDVTNFLSFPDNDHTSATITPSNVAPDGLYTLKVFGRNGQVTVASSQIITKTFHIYQLPSMRLTIRDKNNAAVSDSLCASSLKNKEYTIEASLKKSANNRFIKNYAFSWANADTVPGSPTKATVNVGSKIQNFCSGLGGTQSVTVVANVNNHGCKRSPSYTIPVKTPTGPYIDCSSVKDVVVELSPTEKQRQVSVNIPSYYTQCGDEPVLKVEIRDPKGQVIKYVKNGSNLVANFPIGKSVITYTVFDACENQVSCVKTVTIKDVTPPDVDCSSLPSYQTRLSLYNACEATPGANPALPKLVAPKLADRYFSGVFITAEFAGRSDGKKGLNDPFDVGEWYVKWNFRDASGNATQCTTKVTVINDRKPVVDCHMPDTALSIEADLGLCGAMSDGILSKIDKALGQSPLPTAKTACEPQIPLKAKIFYKKGSGPESLLQNGVKFDVNTVYTFIWRFYNNDGVSSQFIDGTAFSDCSLNVVIRDREAPQVQCVARNIYRVSVNVTSKSGYYRESDYASGTGQNGSPTQGTNYTLKDAFNSLPSASDVCDGEIIPSLYIDSANIPGGRHLLPISAQSYSEWFSLAKAQLMKTKFLKNTEAYLDFVFADSQGNKDSCRITIIVSPNNRPQPVCWLTNTLNLYADAGCKAHANNFSWANMPVADFQYEKVGYKYGNGVTRDIYKRENKQATVYPSVIRREHFKLDASGNYVSDGVDFCNNPAAAEKLVTQYYHHNSGTNDVEAFVEVKTHNYPSEPSCLDTEYDLGRTVITLYYDDDTTKATKCVANVFVADTTKPHVTCGKFQTNGSKTISLPKNKCALSFSEVGLSKPSVRDLLPAGDNCSSLDELSLTWERYKETKPVADLEAPLYDKGLHKVIWIVTDLSGNTSSCVNTILIKDTAAPDFDCSKLHDISVNADNSCKASYSDVVLKGLVAPRALNDPCSPLGDDEYILGVGSRDDGLDLNADYPLGTTVVTWTFKDAELNTKTCSQNVVVVDKSKPVFADCGKLPPLVYNLAPGVCSVPVTSVLKDLGEHEAIDNCDNPVKGVPRMGTDGADDLPNAFAVGSYNIVWVFKDNAGNAIYCYQTVDVKDSNAPDTTGVCPPASFVADAVKGTCSTSIDLGPEPVVNDQCDGDIHGVFSRSDGASLSPSDPFQTGSTTVKWTFTDLQGNVSQCSSTVTVNDVTPPVIFCNDNVNDSLIFAVSKGECGTASEKVVEQVQEPYAYDDCDSSKIASYVSHVIYRGLLGNEEHLLSGVSWNDQGLLYQPGYTDIVFIFADKSGNADSCKFTVYVTDKNAPKIDCNKITSPFVVSPDQGQCNVTWASLNLDDLNPYPAVDSCDNMREYKGIPTNRDDGSLNSPNLPTTMAGGTKLHLRWYYLTVKGGIAVCDQDLEVLDNQPPVFDCSSLKTVTATADQGLCSVSDVSSLDALLALIGTPKAQDNCGEISGVPSRSDGHVFQDPYPTGTTTITWTFADSNPLNTITCTQDVFVKGSVAPEVDCDTFGHFFDTIPDCATRALSLRVPHAIDKCAPEGLGDIVGVPTRSDGAGIDAPFPLGNTAVTWTFTDFTGSVSSSCNDTVNVRTLKSLVINCPDQVTVSADANQCSKSVTLSQPSASHPCLPVKVPGVPFIGGTRLSVSNGQVVYNFRTGVTKVMWVFSDTTNSLVKESDTCYQNVQVGNVNKMPVDCNNFPDIKRTLSGKCSVDASEFGFSDPVVTDLCTGKEIVPDIFTALSPGIIKHNANELGAFNVGSPDTIIRRYVFMSDGQAVPDTMVCHQAIWLRDTLNINVNCPDSSVSRNIVISSGQCEISRDALLDSLGHPQATDVCLSHPIPGVPSLANGSPLPKSFKVGDVVMIRWVYNDPLANTDSVVCFQKVAFLSNQKPLHDDCSLLAANPVVVVASGSCEVTLKDADFLVPLSTDACTMVSYPASGFLLSTMAPAVGSSLKVGSDTIVWVFSSPTSVASDTCYQPLVVRTDKKIDFDCGSLARLDFNTKDCDFSLSSALLSPPVALNPCTNQSITASTPLSSVSLLRNSDTTIVWTFTDHSGTLDDSVKSCSQDVRIVNRREIPVDCARDIKDTIIALPDNVCQLRSNELMLRRPSVVDVCSGNDVDLDYVRSSGKKLTDYWTVGTETLNWVYTMDDSISVTCPQQITIRSSRPLFDCDNLQDFFLDVFAAGTTIGDVLDTVSANAVDPCTGTPIRGRYVVDGVANPKQEPLLRNFIYHVVWTFFDPVLNADSVVCNQNVEIGGVPVPGVHCENYSPLSKVIDGCEASYSSLGLKVDTVVDEHPNGIEGEQPQNILPVVWRQNDDTKYDLNDPQNNINVIYGNLGVGSDVIFYKYTVGKDKQVEVCRQPIDIWDSIKPDVDCSDKVIVARAPKGECSVTREAMVEAMKPFPTAKEHCTGFVITGLPQLLDGSPLPESFKVGDTVRIRWLFTEASLTKDSAFCFQSLTVNSQMEPVFNCSSLLPVELVASGACELALSPLNLPTPSAADACVTSQSFPAKGVVLPGRDSVYKAVLPLDTTTVEWLFSSPYSSESKTCQQMVIVRSDKLIDGLCSSPDYDDIVREVENNSCSVPSSQVLLGSHSAKHPCFNDVSFQGVPSRSDNAALDAPYPIGQTLVFWTFTDSTRTLVTPSSVCTTKVVVSDANVPSVDCDAAFPKATIFLADDECKAGLGSVLLKTNLDNVPSHPCDQDIVAKVDTSRSDGLPMSDPYPVGDYTLTWTFSFPTQKSFTCTQQISVKDTSAPKFNCDELIPIIKVPMTEEGDTVSYQQVVDAGFFIPNVVDPCGEVRTDIVRSDGLKLTAPFHFGNDIVISFTFSDQWGNSRSCEQRVVVTDMVPPTVNCPDLGDKAHVQCAADTVAPYKSFAEFVAAGGSFSDETKILPGSFRFTKEVSGDILCNAEIVHDYFFTTVRDVVVHCQTPQKISVRDTVAPVYNNIPQGGRSDTVSCSSLVDEPLSVTATDNCDPAPVVSFVRTSTQGSDPTKCDYYQYVITYTYQAKDRCGNMAPPVSYVINVTNNQPPVVSLPKHWDEIMHPDYMKQCRFGVPDIMSLVPRNMVQVSCSNDTSLLSYSQSPQVGTLITKPTVVTLTIMDVCGNKVEMTKNVEVQERTDIVKVTTAKDPYVCAYDSTRAHPRSVRNSLSHSEIRDVSGDVWTVDYDSTWVAVPSTPVWDYYRGSIAPENVVYSTNPDTYGKRFSDARGTTAEADAALASYVLLLRRSQSDTYWYVATDTVSGCSDTASVYIDVLEKPRMNFVSGSWIVCENDSLELHGDFGEQFPVCVDDMGGDLTASGWLLNDSVYHSRQAIGYDGGVDHNVYYYATNVCGTTTSHSTLYLACSPQDSLSDADSLASNLDLMRRDSLYVSDSVAIDFFVHYNPGQILLTSYPQDKPRIWEGDNAELQVSTPYKPTTYRWYRVVGEFDARTGTEYDKRGNIILGGEDDDELLFVGRADSLDSNINRFTLVAPADTSCYYVVVSNGVCPATPSNVVKIDVMSQLPTAITPYSKDGLNDVFMKGFHVQIFNRYEELIYEGFDGWDGSYRGILVDPGVYFYHLDLRNGKSRTGSVEVVKVKD